MKYFIILLFFLYNLSLAQNFNFRPQKVDFSKWEEKEDFEKKKNMVTQLKKFTELNFVFNIQKEIEYDLFHIIDFDRDGLNDIIFYGFVGNEIELILFFKNDGSKFKEVLFNGGDPIYISDPEDNFPMSLIIKQYPCCADFVSVIEKIEPVNIPGEFKYIVTSKEAYCDFEESIYPEKYFKHNIKFITTQAKSNLRITPLIGDTTFNYTAVDSTNTAAIYPAGSLGVAIAEKKDTSERVWYFVKMLNNKKPIINIIHGGFLDSLPYCSYGWMSSRVIKKLE